MKAFISVLFLLLLFVFFYIVSPKKENHASIVVSVSPLESFAQRIVQGKMPTYALVHAGQNHETYELSPKEMLLLANAKIFFSTDFPFEMKLCEKLKELNPNITLVDLPKEIFADEKVKDLHIWTSLRLAQEIAKVMVESIVRIDPANEKLYRKGYEELTRDLAALGKEVEKKLSRFRGKKIYVVHPAWGYFLKEYGLEEVSIEKEGKEPTLQDLVSIIEAAKKDKVRVIFIQKGTGIRGANALARAVHGKVEEIDPLEEDYFSNIRTVSSKIQKALENEKADH